MVFGVGYIGSRLIQERLFQAREVVAVDNYFATDSRAVAGFEQAPGFRFVEGSIVDSDTIERALDVAGDIDEVYLLAAQASASASFENPTYSEDSNLRGPRVVLDALVRHKIAAPIVYASSILVYGSPLPAVVDENTPYGIFTDLAHLSKCYGEKLFEMYAALHRLNCRVVRLGLTYGVAPVMKTNRAFMTAPNLFCWQACQEKPLEIRSAAPIALIHVDDAAGALLVAAHAPDNRRFPIFNAATDVATIREVAHIVRRCATERELTTTIRDIATSSQPESARTIIQSSLSNTEFAATRSLSEGLDKTLDHFLVHGQ